MLRSSDRRTKDQIGLKPSAVIERHGHGVGVTFAGTQHTFLPTDAGIHSGSDARVVAL